MGAREDTHGRREGEFAKGYHTRYVIRYLKDRAAAGILEEVLARAGERRSISELMRPSSSSTYGQFRRLLEATAELIGGPEALRDIGRYVFDPLASPEPASVDLARAFVSPEAWLGSMRSETTKYTSMLEFDTEERGPGKWIIRTRLTPGWEPYRELCQLHLGMHEGIVQAFGNDILFSAEEGCQSRGDPWCVQRLHWKPRASEDAGRMGKTRRRWFEARLAGLQRAVMGLVAGERTEFLLSRIASAAAQAVDASAYVLSVTDPATGNRRTYSHGLDEEEASRYAGESLIELSRRGPGVLGVRIMSPNVDYGNLVAIRPPGGHFSPQEVFTLKTYASLAAAALDWSSATEEARRQAAVARGLLDLSSSLVELGDTDGLADKLVRAVPLVVDCDQAIVLVLDDVGNVVTAASQGYEPELDNQIRSLSLGVPDASGAPRGLRFRRAEDPQHGADAWAPVEQCSTLLADFPITFGDELLGWITVGVKERSERLQCAADLGHRLDGLAAQAAIAIKNTRLVEEIRHQALHDHLTGLPNRVLILDRLEQMCIRARRYGTDLALFFIDLDGFKYVNDTYGHEVGDELLRKVGDRFQRVLRATDTVGRLGGDEFVVVAECADPSASPQLMADRLLAALGEPFEIGGAPQRSISISASIGIASGSREDAQELLRDADVALYAAKAAGKQCSVAFEPAMQLAVQSRYQLEVDLRRAAERGEFFLVYQPTFDLRGMRALGVEALLRWRHPDRGIVCPEQFIEVLEETGMIIDVGGWVLDEACRQAAAWRDHGLEIGVSVNVSGRQLGGDLLLRQISDALERHSLEPRSLSIEITESTLMTDANLACQKLREIKELGVKIAIDDFGTGHSSLAYLRMLPVDSIKIDRSFITGMSGSREGKALIHTLVQLGKALKLQTVAEGVEERAQLSRLQAEHCDSGQGFLFARPTDPDTIEQFFRSAQQVGVR